MKNINIIISLSVISVIVVCVFVVTTNRQQLYLEFIDGYWEASHTFCRRSGLNSAQLLFNTTDIDSAESMSVYLLVENSDGKIITNRLAECTLSNRYFGNLACDDPEFTLQFDEDTDVAPLPQRSTLKINIRDGMMGIFNDDTLYLELYKNNRSRESAI